MESLGSMQRYLANLRKRVASVTPNHYILGWISSAQNAVSAVRSHFQHWSGGKEGGSKTGWEPDEDDEPTKSTGN